MTIEQADAFTIEIHYTLIFSLPTGKETQVTIPAREETSGFTRSHSHDPFEAQLKYRTTAVAADRHRGIIAEL